MKFLLLLLLVSCSSTKSGYELAGEFCSCRGGVKNFVDYTEQDDPNTMWHVGMGYIAHSMGIL